MYMDDFPRRSCFPLTVDPRFAQYFSWILLLGFLWSTSASAQVQRNFLNLGFEQPALTATNNAAGCYVQVTDAQVPGWSTNHPNAAGGGTCVSPVPATGSLIELWRTNFNGVPARSGNNFAELNASAASRMYQTVCLTNGEQIRWQLSHRARAGTDAMSFNIDTTANQILRASTTTAGAGTVVAGSCGGGLVGSATCNAPTTTNTWADYTGNFTWNGASGLHNLGFEAISTGSGSTTVGNFLDEIQIFLTPYVELAGGSGSAYESVGSAAIPKIKIVGVLTSSVSLLFQVNVGTSTATLGSDYTTPTGAANYTITIPAGNYDGTSATGSLFDLGITILDDSVIDNNETVVVNLLSNPSTYTVASTSNCGAAATSQVTYTILDDDVDLVATKVLGGSATPPAGSNVQFTVTFRNNTARPTIGDATAHDATATLGDAIPAGFMAFNWICTASGTPQPVCPAASGTGAINATATLPAGNGNGGGTLTFVVTGTLAASQCTLATNLATATPAAPFAEGTSAQSGFATPAPGGIANNRASADVDPACADLSITKTNGQSSVTSGVGTTYTIVVSNNGPDSVNGAVLVDAPGSGIACPGANVVSCSGGGCPAGPITVASLLAGLTLGTITATAGSNTVTLSFTCQVQ